MDLQGGAAREQAPTVSGAVPVCCQPAACTAHEVLPGNASYPFCFETLLNVMVVYQCTQSFAYPLQQATAGSDHTKLSSPP